MPERTFIGINPPDNVCVWSSCSYGLGHMMFAVFAQRRLRHLWLES